MNMICENKVAIITGAAGNGMGRSIALTLAREGANVVINYRSNEKEATKIVDHIKNHYKDAIKVQGNIFEINDCKKLVEKTIEHFGKIDICIIGPGGGWHPESIDLLNSATTMDDVNSELAPIFHLMPLILPEMYKQKWGRLIGISMHSEKISPAYSYNIGKAARTQALLLAQEQAWENYVTINIVAPGPVPEFNDLNEAIDQCNHRQVWNDRTTVTPQDIAEGVAFLCSDAGRYIGGCVLPYL
jgi:NAD(P)-dependent dehydrogenase (short-subunit alcohol dehydrogenase family)